jgi:hypothetical protein
MTGELGNLGLGVSVNWLQANHVAAAVPVKEPAPFLVLVPGPAAVLSGRREIFQEESGEPPGRHHRPGTGRSLAAVEDSQEQPVHALLALSFQPRLEVGADDNPHAAPRAEGHASLRVDLARRRVVTRIVDLRHNQRDARLPVPPAAGLIQEQFADAAAALAGSDRDVTD